MWCFGVFISGSLMCQTEICLNFNKSTYSSNWTFSILLKTQTTRRRMQIDQELLYSNFYTFFVVVVAVISVFMLWFVLFLFSCVLSQCLSHLSSTVFQIIKQRTVLLLLFSLVSFALKHILRFTFKYRYISLFALAICTKTNVEDIWITNIAKSTVYISLFVLR